MAISRILKNNGKLIIAFSNRAFWTKAPNIWTYSSEDTRIEYVKNVLSANGWKIDNVFKEKTHEEKLFGLYSVDGDPFFSVVARNIKSSN